MKRFHVHLAVTDLDQSVRFYSTLFGQRPAVRKDDYAKWMLDDPRINFAVSTRGRQPGVNHLGVQVDDELELNEARDRLQSASIDVLDQSRTACCYAKSDKYWTTDPQGIAWETFRTLGEVPIFGDEARTPATADGACCIPHQAADAKAGVCCVPTAGEEQQTGCCR